VIAGARIILARNRGRLRKHWNMDMNLLSQIVVASSDMESRRKLVTILRKLGLDSICASTVGECREMLAAENVVLVFCDQDLMDGCFGDVLDASHSARRQPRVVLTGQLRNSGEYHAALDLGAFGVTATPYQPTDVEWIVIQATRYQRKRFPNKEDAELGDIQAIMA
jgi:DNA-binding NtrC family response regulator